MSSEPSDELRAQRLAVGRARAALAEMIRAQGASGAELDAARNRLRRALRDIDAHEVETLSPLDADALRRLRSALGDGGEL